MAFNQAQLEELEQALVSPEKTVKFNGREITKEEAKDLLKTYNFVKGELDVNTTNPRKSYSVASFE